MSYNNAYKAKVCMEAFREVKSVVHDNYGADNVGDPKRVVVLSDGSSGPIDAYVKFMREQAKAMGKGKGQAAYVAAYAKAAKHFKCGRCMGQAALAAMHLLSKNVNCSIVLVDMNNGDTHALVVADAVKATVGTSLKTLGGTPICDPWVSLKSKIEKTIGLGAGISAAVKHSAVLETLGYSSVIKHSTPLTVLNGG